MFFHSFKYALKNVIRIKETVFWSLIFPIALSSFMFAAFGHIYETTEVFHSIKTAVVENKENETFKDVIKSIEDEGDDALLDAKTMKEDEALKALDNEDVDGIIYIDDEVHLKVKESGMNQTILTVFLNKYIQMEDSIKNIHESNPAGLPKALEVIENDCASYREVSTSNGNQDNLINYFYAIFAMSCLFASFSGVDRAIKIQANISALGQRRAMSPTHKLKTIIAEFAATELVQFAIECITFFYVWKVLGVDFGDKIPAIFPILFLGSAFGVSFGMFIGALPKPATENGKVGITVSICMALSIMADLCVGGITNLINHTVPIINHINPATLITDSFYSLSIYDTYTRYYINMATLAGLVVLFWIANYLMIRRNRYASL